MPTYAYKCPQCGHRFELFHKMSDPCCPACPECDTETDRVITGGAGLHFKGSGFYATDYKKSSGGDDAKQDKPDAKPKTDKKAGATDAPTKKKTAGD